MVKHIVLWNFNEGMTAEALKTYQTHPDHVAAGGYVRSVTCNRSCMDYEC